MEVSFIKTADQNTKIANMEMTITSNASTIPATTAISAHTTVTTSTAAPTSVKTLKRCLSVPIIHTLPGAASKPSATTMTTRSAAAAAAANAKILNKSSESMQETPKKYQNSMHPDSSTSNFGTNIHIGIPHSNPSSREVSPAPVFNIFAPRARRYSASSTTTGGTALCMTPRVSQLRQEECVDVNSREMNHEREIHNAMQISQSWEDLTLVAENWSCKSDEFSNPLQVVLPSGGNTCSSPSPTSTRAGGLRLPYGLSPSPTRRTFATRRSMSPIAMRPSPLAPVKRKFELDDNNSNNWNVYSPPPLKKIFTESRGSSPVCQSPSSVCPSPDSGTYDGRITPKLFISKLCTNNTNNNTSTCSSPMSASPSSSSVNGGAIESTTTSALCTSTSFLSTSSSTSLMSGGSEPMCISNNIDEGISISESEDKQCSSTTSTQALTTEMQDDTTLMDDIKSETSSIGGCSSISIESSSCDSGTKTSTTFHNKLIIDDFNSSPLGPKSFFINKQGLSGPKKYIVNHDNIPANSIDQIDISNGSIRTVSTIANSDGNSSSNTSSITNTNNGNSLLCIDDSTTKSVPTAVIIKNRVENIREIDDKKFHLNFVFVKRTIAVEEEHIVPQLITNS